jgi:phosphohistidine swiveling domain-containing protein
MIERTDPEAVLPAEAFNSWLSASPLETALKLLYADADVETSVSGWADRRLVTEFLFLRTPLSSLISEELAGLPGRGVAGPWQVKAVSVKTPFSRKSWRASTLAGLYDAVRLILAETWSACIEDSKGESSRGNSVSGLIVQAAAEPDSAYPVTDPGAIGEQMFSIHGAPAAEERLAASRYAFGHLYNRLIHPPHPFNFMRLLLTDPDVREIDLWENSALAAGYDPSLRLMALRDSREEFTLRSSVVRDAPVPVKEKSLHLRQVSGSPGMTGGGRGQVWHCMSSEQPPEGPLILVTEEWNAAVVALIEQAAGYVETAGGRGSCGSLETLRRGIPSISEARQAVFVPQSVSAVIDSDTGILTLL